MSTPRSTEQPAIGPLLLTVEQTAAALQVGRTTLYAILATGDLRSRYIGTRRYVARADLVGYIEGLPTTSPAA